MYSSAYITAITFIGIDGIPRTIGLIQPVLLLVLVGASRAFARLIFGDVIKSRKRQNSLPQMLVYGAGKSGRQLAAAIARLMTCNSLDFLMKTGVYTGINRRESGLRSKGHSSYIAEVQHY